MRIYYIRHGQSYNNALQLETNSRIGRKADPDLTTIGRQQAEVLAAFLQDHHEEHPIDNLYCSLMQRAIQTAIPVARDLKLPLHGLYDSHESGGLYLDDHETNEPVGQAGTTPEDLRTRYPQLILPENLNEEGWWSRPWETVAERVTRAQRLVKDLKERHGSHSHVIALISHQGFFNHFFFALLGQTRPQNFWFTLNNISITCLDVVDDQVNAVFINRMSHIPRELWTW